MREAMQFVLEVSATWATLSFIAFAFIVRKPRQKKPQVNKAVYLRSGNEWIVVSSGRL